MRRAVAAAALVLAACLPRVHLAPLREALGAEGEVWVYLQPLPEDAARLALSFEEVALARGDGTLLPLELALRDLPAGGVARQRLLASGRAPPGSYPALVVRIRRATLSGEAGPVDLLVPEEPVRVDLDLELGRGRARVVQLALRPGQALDQDFSFGAAFSTSARPPAAMVAQLAGYCPSAGSASVAVFDRRAKQVVSVFATGREPRAVAVDGRAARGYVALAGEDQIQVVDLATGEELRRIPLRPGDEPRDLALTPDGRLLVAANRGSNSAAVLETEPGLVLDRVPAGDAPWSLLLDRAGRRAYVLNRRSNDVTVVDVGNRAAVGTIATDPEPIGAALNRAETRLYVVHRGSAWMNAYSLPDLAPAGRFFVGLGAGAVKVDPRTGRILVGRDDAGRIDVYDPVSLLPVDGFDVPGPVAYLAIDEMENALVVVMPALRSVALVDLTSRRVLSSVDVGDDPGRAVVIGER
ncbi:MAG TPA: YncE family protein [Anaeromyxobacteraceae bacterium]|nr:YncE family protein [Anaeromyxobacteraceae bacterium]